MIGLQMTKVSYTDGLYNTDKTLLNSFGLLIQYKQGSPIEVQMCFVVATQLVR